MQDNGEPGFQPLLARTRSIRRPIAPVVYDCVRVVVIRDGTAILHAEFGQKPVRPGDVLCRAEPEGQVTFTAVMLDPDYVLDQLRWQHAGVLQDRLAAQDFAETIYTEPTQILCLDEDRAAMLTPWLDELVRLSASGQFARDYFRIQALWFQITAVIAPLIKASPVRHFPVQRTYVRPTLPRYRRFVPLRAEARHVAALLRGAPERPWTLVALAAEAHLSPSRLSSVFVEAYGKTPLAFLTMIRAENLARYLRETDLTVDAAMQRVGWHSRSHATRLFREYVGVTPGYYRQMRLSVSA